MIIELFGIPATGKTTFSKKISQSCDIPLITIDSKTELLFFNVIFIFYHPLFSLKTLFYIVKESYSFSILYLKFMNTFLQHNAKYVKARRNGKGVIDEGHLQNILSIFESSQENTKIKKYMKILPKIDIYILMYLDENERKKRIHKRGYEARDHIPYPKKVEQWKKAIHYQKQMVFENKKVLPEVSVVSSEKEKQEFIKKYCS